MGEPTETLPTTTLVHDKEQDGDQEIEGTLTLLEGLMDSVRRSFETDCLETAISWLRDALHSGTHAEESRLAIYHQLITALLVRYGVYGWIEDLDLCLRHLFQDVGLERDKEFALLCHNSNENPIQVDVPAQLVRACRSSIDIATLNDVVCIATEALDTYKSSYSGDKLALQLAKLRILLGKALVMRYLNNREIIELNQADRCLQQGITYTSLECMSLTSLQHIEWLRLTECGNLEAFHQLCDYHERGVAAEEAGRNFYKTGNAVMTQGVNLQEGIELLIASLNCCARPHPRRSIVLNALANALVTQFQRTGNHEKLEGAIMLHREALDLRLAPHPCRSSSLNNLADSLSLRFEHKGAFLDLEECITLFREALHLRGVSHSGRSESLDNLARSLSDRFKHKGVFGDLEESIALHQEAIHIRRPHHPDRSLSLSNLARSLSDRFRHKGAIGDLEKCITLLREALDICQPPHPNRPSLLINLANSLSTRFKEKGTFEDMEECIKLNREALDLCRAPHLGRSWSLNNLADSLSSRFKHRGSFEDLEESVILNREALNLCQPPHPDRPNLLNNLANSLFLRFEHKGAFKDLEECITLHREALYLRSPPHPDRLRSLSNLANSLSFCFQHKGAIEHLDESIKLLREALDLHPLSHPDRSGSLDSLARSLSLRFEHEGAFGDLEECITLLREALELRRPPHPDHSLLLNNLASSLLNRFEYKGIPSDIEGALQYLQEAAKYPTGSLFSRLNSSKSWVNCAQKHRPASTLDAYKYSMGLLPQLASVDLTVQQRQDVLQHGRDLIGEAAKCAIDAGQIELALTFLSTGRSIFWSQALQLRAPVDELMAKHSAIAARFIAVSGHLENASYSEQVSASTLSTAGLMSPNPSLYKLANQRQEIIEEIRMIPGYEGFLLPHSFLSLRPAAKKGPIIFLNASILRCDAIVMHEAGHPEVIPLPDIHWRQLQHLKMLIHDLSRSGMRSIEISQDMMDTFRKWLERDMVLENSGDSSEEIFRSTLESLWVKIVQPIINTLCIEKTGSPTRIWWCPTGPFSSLPVHAAGVYSTENEPIDCLFQYAVSSYITSPQDLLHSPPSITQYRPYNVTAVIEPETIDYAAALPFTVHELQKIVVHVPHQHLVAKVGSKRTPNQIDDIVSSIQQSSFVHFGCHGTQSLKDPLESCLLLSGGRLTMSKLMKECRVPEGALAYLSACETAKGDDVRPDESLNLVATMMFAGFRSVVGTMWSILDCDAPIVADVFYQHLFRNGAETPPNVTDAAYGLHLATKKLRDGGRPFFSWVPYVHYGI